MGLRGTKKVRHDMFGRPAEADTTLPSQIASSRGVAAANEDRGDDRRRALEQRPGSWGNQANFDLAGSPSRLQAVIADLWNQWWRPWALLGILIVGLAIVLIVSKI